MGLGTPPRVPNVFLSLGFRRLSHLARLHQSVFFNDDVGKLAVPVDDVEGQDELEGREEEGTEVVPEGDVEQAQEPVQFVQAVLQAAALRVNTDVFRWRATLIHYDHWFDIHVPFLGSRFRSLVVIGTPYHSADPSGSLDRDEPVVLDGFLVVDIGRDFSLLRSQCFTTAVVCSFLVWLVSLGVSRGRHLDLEHFSVKVIFRLHDFLADL